MPMRIRLCGVRLKLSMSWRYAEAQATVLLCDGFAVLGPLERPDVVFKLGDNDRDWVDVSGDRVGKRHALPLVARFTNDRWDNTVGVCDRFDTQLDADALGSFHGSRRVTQLLQWAAPPPLARVTQAERRELRFAVSSVAGSELAIEGGSVRALFEQRLLPLVSGVDAAFVALLAAHVPLVHDAALALRLSRRPLRQAAAPLQRAGTARRAPQRLAAQRDRVAHARPGLLRA
jgi:hypothetical protein